MLGLIGIKKNVDIEVREKLAISHKKLNRVLKELKEVFDEVVILSTCNRTEIYYNTKLEEEYSRDIVFHILSWSKELEEFTFFQRDDDVIRHLFEVVCGFHSKILGEDQILGQIRDSLEISIDNNSVSAILLRLFEESISCGKKFRVESKLFEIPVSSSSIAVNKAAELGAKRIMVMGYGNIGSLVMKYALGSDFTQIKLVVRNKDKATDIVDDRVEILDYDEAKEVINYMDAVISCTSAPHLIVKREDINVLGKNIALIDLALPRDIDKSLKELKRVYLYDIDDISKLDYENKLLRTKKMKSKKYIIEEYISSFSKWLEIREISNHIKSLKNISEEVVGERVQSFKNKCSSDEDINLATTLIKSTSDYYLNRAIKVLKAEKLKGREEECLRIIKGIFMEN